MESFVILSESNSLEWSMKIDYNDAEIYISACGLVTTVTFYPFSYSDNEWKMMIQHIEDGTDYGMSDGGNSSSGISWKDEVFSIYSEVSGNGGDMYTITIVPKSIGKKLLSTMADFIITHRDAYEEHWDS